MTYILAAHAEHLNKNFDRGFLPMSFGEALETLSESPVFIGPRPWLETRPEFRQLITYVVLRQGDTYYSYSRAKAGSEERLHAKRSIGIGGHVDFTDMLMRDIDTINLRVTIRLAVERELVEESTFRPTQCHEKNFLGLLVDDSDAVGRVHVGLVFVIDIPDGAPPIRSNEDALTDFRATPLADLSNLENWSALVTAHLKGAA